MSTVKNRVLIVWISTGDYNKRFNQFIESLNNFLPDCDVKVAVVSDRSESYFADMIYKMNTHNKDKSGNGLYDRYLSHTRLSGGVLIHYHNVDHMPWPIITTLKPKYILMSMNIKCRISKYRIRYYKENGIALEDNWSPDYVCYCNSNIKFIRKITAEEVLNKNHISVVHNPAWWYEGCDPNKFTYGKPIDPKFKCAIDGYYEYLQAAFYIGPTNLIKELSESQMRMTSYDLAHNRIPCFHDESYFNKWCHDNPDKINILPKEYLMDWDRKDLFECPNPKIAMMNSDDTQYEYKDKYFE